MADVEAPRHHQGPQTFPISATQWIASIHMATAWSKWLLSTRHCAHISDSQRRNGVRAQKVHLPNEPLLYPKISHKTSAMTLAFTLSHYLT